MAFYKYTGTREQILAIYNASKGLPNSSDGQPRRFTADEIEILQDWRAAIKPEIGDYIKENERLAKQSNEIRDEQMRNPNTPRYMQAVKENDDAIKALSDGMGKEIVSVVVADNVHTHVKTCVTGEKAWLAVNDEALDFALACIKLVKDAPSYSSIKQAMKPAEPEESESEEEPEAEEGPNPQPN